MQIGYFVRWKKRLGQFYKNLKFRIVILAVKAIGVINKYDWFFVGLVRVAGNNFDLINNRSIEFAPRGTAALAVAMSVKPVENWLI